MTKRSWLEILEYLSVAGSVAGSVAAIATQQIVYAATPLSLSVILNLANRRRLAQEPSIGGNSIELGEKLARELKILREQVQGLPTDSEFNHVQSAVSKHSEEFEEVKRQLEKTLSLAQGLELSPLRQDISVLRENYAGVQETLTALSAQLQSAESPKSGHGVERWESAIAQINSKIAQFQNKLSKLETGNATPDLNPVLSEIAQIEQRLETVRASVSQAIEQEIAGLRADLEARVSAGNPLEFGAEQVSSLSSEIAKLQERQQALEQAIAPVSELRMQLEQLNQKVAAQPDVEQVERLRNALSLAIALIPQLEQQLDLERLGVSARGNQEAIDLTGVDESLRKIAESVSEAITEIDTRLAPLEAVNLRRIQEDLALQTRDLEQLTSGLAALQQEQGSWQTALASLQEKIEGLPQFVAPEALEPLEAALTTLKERVDLLGGFPIPELQDQLEQLADRVNNLPSAIASQSDVEQLNQALREVTANLAEVRELTTSLENQSEVSSRLSQLDSIVSELSSRLDETLPQERDALRQEVQSLREQLEWQGSGVPNAVSSEVTHQIHELLEQFNSRPELEQIESLTASVSELDRRLEQLPNPSQSPAGGRDAEAIDVLRLEISELRSALAQVSESIGHLSDVTPERIERLEVALGQLEGQLEQWRNRPGEVSVQPQIEQLSQQLKALATHPEVPNNTQQSGHLQSLISPAIAQQLYQIESLLEGIKAHQYELVFDRPSIRAQLFEAIETAEHRLILVCPWVSRAGLDGTLLQKLEGLLQQGVQVEIGWGHLRDIEAGEFPIRINEHWQLDPMAKRGLYDALNDLEHLRTQYGDRLQLKVLGTHENFLVCDDKWAMLATHHFLSSSDALPEREVGLRTTDPKIIHGLIERFSEPLLNPANASAYYNRGFERLDIGDYQGAVEDYTRALQIDGNQPTAYNNRGLAKFQIGDFAGAVADYTRSLELNDNEAVVYFNRGFARFNQGDYTGAIGDYTESILKAPEQTSAYFYRGEAYGRLGNYQQAAEDYTRALQLNPQDAVAYNNRGLARYNQADYAGAIADYTEALRLKPDDAVAYLNRGVARSAGTDYHGAIEDFTQALSLNEKYASAYNYRGRARAEMGDRQGAIGDLQTAANLFSRQGDTIHHQQAIAALTALASAE
ncbi:tetratricopeptide repeat protein [Laspinema olomoucense]|uniref:Tetratricopeptide repeat protein n=1 Tax=Laspinema olomoucense D3b TaxID=2953688 RepID=A0ABT2NHS3_9CYAN|nr:tetratricopeptide repeat protein [Laspinema sp. D3b]MCT7980900.1 tetratricopeptide repeat protein [Laspinema sp. D3b]